MDNTVAEEVAKNLTPGAQTEEEKLDESLKFGSINYESANGVVQSNCKAMQFATVDELNEYFRAHPGTFATQVSSDPTGILCIVNRTLTKEEQTILEEQGDVMRTMLAEKKKQREDAKAAEEAANQAKLDEVERMLALGRQCEKNHAAVIEDNGKLKKENASLRKTVADLQKIQAKKR